MFNFLAGKVNGEVAWELSRQGLISMLPPPSEAFAEYVGTDKLPTTDVSYVDDATFFVAACLVADLIQKLAALALTVAKVYMKHGFLLNYKVEKSEGLVNLKGPGAKTEYAKPTLQDDTCMNLPL